MIDDVAFATLGIAGPSHKLVASGSAALNRHEVADRVLPLPEHLEDPDAGRMAERLEELRLQLVDGRGHLHLLKD